MSDEQRESDMPRTQFLILTTTRHIAHRKRAHLSNDNNGKGVLYKNYSMHEQDSHLKANCVRKILQGNDNDQKFGPLFRKNLKISSICDLLDDWHKRDNCGFQGFEI